MLELQPISFKEACRFVNRYHKHHRPPMGWKFGIAVNDGERVVGVIITSRPVARHLDDGYTLEVTRCCTDGSTKNAASKLYAAAWRAARSMGYRRMISYTLEEEKGTSLIAAGYKLLYTTKKNNWNRPNIGRLRVDKHPTGQKKLWEIA